MSSSAGQQLGSVLRALFRLLRQVLRVCVLILGCAGPPPPPHEIRGRTPAVQYESGARRK